MPSYWKDSYLWKHDCSLVTLRVAAADGADGPSDEQRAFVEELETRYAYFRAGALVLLKPAFRQYVGEQERLKSLLEEFLLTGVTVPRPCRRAIAVHEFLIRCCTDPSKAFYVTTRTSTPLLIRVHERRVNFRQGSPLCCLVCEPRVSNASPDMPSGELRYLHR